MQTVSRADHADCADRLVRWRISTVTAGETLTNSFTTYYPIDFDIDMAKVPFSVTTNQFSTPIQKPPR